MVGTSQPHRSLWLEQALDGEYGQPAADALHGQERADVCIVGGGYAGLWTAIRLKQADPALDVVLVEADICGGGASGRNGGFALSWWVKAHELVRLCGREDGTWLCQEAQSAIDEIGSFCAEHEIDADFAKAGWLWGASATAQLGAWDSTVSYAEELGADIYRRVSLEEARDRSGSGAFVGGVLDTTGATIDPARLARGLRGVVQKLGVRIYEQSPVRNIDTNSTRPAAVTAAGRVDADRVVLTLGAWSPTLPELRDLRRSMVVVSSDAIATEPIPELLAKYGPKGREGVSDARLMVRYARTHRERLIFGVAGGHLAYGTRVGQSFDYGRKRSAAIERTFRVLYPALAGARITHAWGGPVERTEGGVPMFGRLPGSPAVIYCAGFSGNGLGPAVLASHILTSLTLDRDDRWSSIGLIGTPRAAFPPEPFRFVGGLAVKRAVRLYEDATDLGNIAPLPVRALTRLAPAGLVKGSGESGH